MTITGKGDPLVIFAWPIGEQGGEVIGAEEFGQFSINEVEISLSLNAGFVCPEKLLEALVATEIDTIRIFQPDEVGHGVKQGAKMAAFSFEFGYRILSRRPSGQIVTQQAL